MSKRSIRRKRQLGQPVLSFKESATKGMLTKSLETEVPSWVNASTVEIVDEVVEEAPPVHVHGKHCHHH